MSAEMKEIIAESARTLIFEKRVKKLTVKDIVEECNITRQTFYYHFEVIPGLFRWILEQGSKKMLEKARSQNGAEDAIRYFILVAINARPYIEKSIQTNYRDEVESLISDKLYQILEQIVAKEEIYQNLSHSELKFVLRYHSQAILGILRSWNKEDTKNLDQIVHNIYLLIMAGFSRFSKA